MKAKVKKTSHIIIVTAFGGFEYTQNDWRPVPAGKEAEAEANPYLETEVEVSEKPTPKPAPKPRTRTRRKRVTKVTKKTEE